MPLYSVKTMANREESCVDRIVKRSGEEIYSAIAPDEMVGYILVEAESIEAVERIAEDVSNAGKVLKGEVSMEEIDNFFSETNEVKNIEEGQIVEVLADSFRGETAKVKSVDESKERLEVELLEAEVPIPINLRGDNVRVIDKDP